MPRKKFLRPRDIQGDPRYANKLVAKFINCMMYDGKKTNTSDAFYGAMDILGKKHGEGALNVFKSAVDNVRPMLEVKSRRVGGATYQVPVEIAPATRTALAFRWIIEFARKRGEKTMKERLAGELLDCYSKQGATMKRKDDTHRMAEANKAFAHFRF